MTVSLVEIFSDGSHQSLVDPTDLVPIFLDIFLSISFFFLIATNFKGVIFYKFAPVAYLRSF